ncbi:hypothetical protein JB92DRAFT_2902377 [Gautieria morchelliformis]|nr:hypothetical protein JB92DRAFT_2902377 [Gautieria morchelliformis]
MSPGLSTPSASSKSDAFLLDDDDGWQDMPVIRQDDFANGLDEEDQKKYHYVAPTKSLDGPKGNATGNLIDFDDYGNEWRSKLDQNEDEYTRLRVDEDEDAEDVHLRTKYLFDEDKAMTPLNQMQATKTLLTEAQRIAYVALCALAIKEMANRLKIVKSKELKAAIGSLELWGLRILGRLYYHMELATPEQKMIETLAEHGVQAMDLVPSLMTTHTVANPEYDPAEAQRQEAETREKERLRGEDEKNDIPEDKSDGQTLNLPNSSAHSQTLPASPTTAQYKTTANVLQSNATTSMPGVSTTLSSADASVTLDIRWTVLCDLFLLLIADSVYDSRSRVLLETVALKLGLGWLDVVKFEKRVTDALEIQEDVEKTEQQDVIDGRMKAAKKKRYVMMGLATLGGGLVIGLSAGLLAPVIGAGLGAAFTTLGVTGTTGFFAGAGGAALITTGGALTGSGIAVRGMARRTQQVRTFELLPLHNNKRVNCIITVPGFMSGPRDDVRLPFSVLDPIVGDVFSVRWEPEMMGETGNAIKLLTGEILSQLSTTVLQATVMTTLMSALAWPIVLTKLGYLIDNPWSNALDRARAAGSVLADILLQRHLGVRPIMLIGFSLGARVIFYALLELAKHKAYGIVQDVFLLGATVTVPTRTWLEARGVVAGRLVNGYARNDWVLNYLFRATSGGLNTVAGLRPIEHVPGLENVDVTDKIAGHNSYRAFMPLILDELGFPVSADYFDEPEEPDMEGDREVVREGEDKKKKRGWFSKDKKTVQNTKNVQRPPSSLSLPRHSSSASTSPSPGLDDLPERIPHSPAQPGSAEETASGDSTSSIPIHAGFDFNAIKEMLQKEGTKGKDELVGMQIPTEPTRSPPAVSGTASPTETALPIQSEQSRTRRTSAASDVSSSARPVQQSNIHSKFDTVSEAPVGLAQTLTQSLSLSDIKASSQREPSLGADLSLNSLATSASQFASRPPPATLSFGSSDGSLWTSDPDPIPPRDRTTFGVPMSKTAFAASTDTLSFGNGTRSVLPHADPFAAPGPSFGADGTIADGDPWAPPPKEGMPKKPSYSSNPWG